MQMNVGALIPALSDELKYVFNISLFGMLLKFMFISGGKSWVTCRERLNKGTVPLIFLSQFGVNTTNEGRSPNKRDFKFSRFVPQKTTTFYHILLGLL